MSDRLLLYPGLVEPLEPSLTQVPIIGWDPGQKRPYQALPRPRPSATFAPTLAIPNTTPIYFAAENPRPVALFDRSPARDWGVLTGAAGPIEPIQPVPTNRVGGRGKPMLRRTPVPLLPADSMEPPDPEARRAGRNSEILVRIVNSLLRTGAIYQDEADRTVWRISANGIINGDRKSVV